MEQRKSQINLLNFIEKDRRDSKEFLFPDDSLLQKRRPSAPPADHSATQSEDDESVGFEVNENVSVGKLFNFEALESVEIQFSCSSFDQIAFTDCLFNFPLPSLRSPTW